MTLNDQQQALLQKLLKQRFYVLRDEISQELLASDDQNYIDLAGQVRDSAEESLADLIRDIDHAIVGLHIDEIRAIDAALLRMAHGTYGLCVDCEAPIKIDRLEVQPTASRCHDCQIKWESKPGRTTGGGATL